MNGLDELRSRQALHDELTATRRYAYRLPAPPGRVSPEDLLRSLDAMLTQLAEVVGRLQETVEIQGRLLDRVADRMSAYPSSASTRSIASAASRASSGATRV